jgi:hypothetical protein
VDPITPDSPLSFSLGPHKDCPIFGLESENGRALPTGFRTSKLRQILPTRKYIAKMYPWKLWKIFSSAIGRNLVLE